MMATGRTPPVSPRWPYLSVRLRDYYSPLLGRFTYRETGTDLERLSQEMRALIKVRTGSNGDAA